MTRWLSLSLSLLFANLHFCRLTVQYAVRKRLCYFCLPCPWKVGVRYFHSKKWRGQAYFLCFLKVMLGPTDVRTDGRIPAASLCVCDLVSFPSLLAAVCVWLGLSGLAWKPETDDGSTGRKRTHADIATDGAFASNTQTATVMSPVLQLSFCSTSSSRRCCSICFRLR